MTILVTGGAGFIGSNFVLDWLVAGDEPVVNLDALTYAGNLRKPARRCDGDARHVFVQGDIGDRALVDRLLAEHRPRAVRALRRREPRRPQHPRPGGLHADQRRRHVHAAGGGARATGAALQGERSARLPLPARLHRRGLRLAARPTRRPSPRQHPYEPNSPYSASKAASDHLVRAWHHTYGLPVLTTNCSQQLRARITSPRS